MEEEFRKDSEERLELDGVTAVEDEGTIAEGHHKQVFVGNSFRTFEDRKKLSETSLVIILDGWPMVGLNGIEGLKRTVVVVVDRKVGKQMELLASDVWAQGATLMVGLDSFLGMRHNRTTNIVLLGEGTKSSSEKNAPSYI
mmetsp:Transcript_637/g.1019  ORF Transcript_637/g.1019 Transcript_637/m.1019 type:complete len:141 (-) Transcript_637:109-531(-)